MKKILVCAPNEIGFKQYTLDLHHQAIQHLNAEPELFPIKLEDPLFFDPLKSQKALSELCDKIKTIKPDLIHFHHEYGVMGSKRPIEYKFPALIKKLKAYLPLTKITATAHTVIPSNFSYPVKGRGLQAPLRFIANYTLKPALLYLWNQKTWGACDGVSVHSRHQIETIQKSGCPYSTVIPHYIPPNEPPSAKEKPPLSLKLHQALLKNKAPIIFVFGYFTPEKGQDIAIEAFHNLKLDAHLILAGGIRRKEDEPYYNKCVEKIKKLNLTSKISITGFIDFHDLDLLCSKATLALIPFRETSGSGSLADLFTRRMPTLASNLKLNIEIDERSPGCLSFFESENPKDCAFIIENLLHHPEYFQKLKEGIQHYSQKFSAQQISKEYIKFFRNVLSA